MHKLLLSVGSIYYILCSIAYVEQLSSFSGASHLSAFRSPRIVIPFIGHKSRLVACWHARFLWTGKGAPPRADVEAGLVWPLNVAALCKLHIEKGRPAYQERWYGRAGKFLRCHMMFSINLITAGFVPLSSIPFAPEPSLWTRGAGGFVLVPEHAWEWVNGDLLERRPCSRLVAFPACRPPKAGNYQHVQCIHARPISIDGRTNSEDGTGAHSPPSRLLTEQWRSNGALIESGRTTL